MNSLIKMHNFKYLASFIVGLSFFLSCSSQKQTSNSFAITGITLIDVEQSKSRNNVTILVEDGKIKSIFSRNDNIIIDDGVEVLDMTGHYAIPGLIDAHVHLFRPKNRNEILENLLYSGVTSVRNMGGDARVYQELNNSINQGELIGPKIYYSATFFGPKFLVDPRTKFTTAGLKPGQAPWSRVITDTTNLKQVITDAKQMGVTGIKVYSNIAPQLLIAISEESHLQGLKVWSHSTIFPSRPRDAVKAKVDVISHSIGIITESAQTIPDNFNDAIKNFMPFQNFAEENAYSEEFLSLFENMKANNTLFEPTLSAWNPSLRQQINNSIAKAENVNPTAHLSKATKKLDVEAMNEWAMRITYAAYENGVLIVAGTDLTKSIKYVQDEIKFLTECGLSNMDALKAGTINNAKAIGIEKTHGSISVGKQADLVILSENPLEDIENIRKVISVYKNGKSYTGNNN